MTANRIRKVGNSYVVTIPPKEMEARGLRVGQLVGFDPVPLELRPADPPRLSPDEEADTSGDVSHEQVMRELEERAARDVAAGLVNRAEVQQAREDIEQDAAWTRSL
jgi:antitoxin component of MazEF toxin-antitoxin module